MPPVICLFLLLAACAQEAGGPASGDSDALTTPGTAGDSGAVGADTGEPFSGPPESVTLPERGLRAEDLAIVVNLDDPLSADIAAAYAEARGIDDTRIVGLSLGTEASLSASGFEAEKAVLDAMLDDDVQALLLAFTQPYRVGCMGTSAAFALGFDEAYCSTPCSPTQAAPTYNSSSTAPWTDHGVRPAMMLAVDTLEDAQALIQRGLDADETNPTGTGWLVRTSDAARSVRYADFQGLPDRFAPDALDLRYQDAVEGDGEDTVTGAEDVLFYLTGLTHVADLETNTWRPGALADHLTSFWGVLSDSSGQMPITAWLEAGATASYGTAHEPCNYQQKFPRASVLVPAYFAGDTALEAYWRSVQWPGEGNFVGEPLARPFSPSWSWEDGTLTLSSTALGRLNTWQLEAADSADGPWEPVGTPVETGTTYARVQITVEGAHRRHYRLVPVD